MESPLFDDAPVPLMNLPSPLAGALRIPRIPLLTSPPSLAPNPLSVEMTLERGLDMPGVAGRGVSSADFLRRVCGTWGTSNCRGAEGLTPDGLNISEEGDSNPSMDSRLLRYRGVISYIFCLQVICGWLFVPKQAVTGNSLHQQHSQIHN